MKKTYNLTLILILLVNMVMVILLFQLGTKLTRYEHVISNLEGKIEDLDDIIEGQVVPDLREIKDKDKVRESFVKDGKEILSVMPEPGLSAGKMQGYIFSFSEPFDTFKDKELAIYAYHEETGQKVTAVSPKLIDEDSTGSPTLERFAARIELPLSGLWRYEIVIDGQFYADVVLSVN